MERHHTHTVRTRYSHWINAAVIGFLLWTGFSMFAGDRHFAAVVRMLPAAFWHAVHFVGTKRQLFTWHVYAGTFFGINGIAYVVSLIATGAWRRTIPTGKHWVHDPQRPLEYTVPQRVAYSAVLAAASLMVLTGVALWFKHQIPWLLASLGGERLVLPIHVILATSVLAFIAIHLIQVLRAGIPALRSMTVGGTLSKGPVPVRLPVETPL
jgi:thiosulfate reductase cytochrome b subunit